MLHKTGIFKTLTLCALAAFCTVSLTTGAIAEESPLISHNEPQITASEPEPIPVVTESRVPTWVWWTIAIAAAAGGGAVALSGGGGGGTSSPPPATSSSTVSW
jgi:hypothetical protein